MKAKKTESIKVDSKLKRKVERHIKNTRQTIGGFYDLAAQEKINKDLHLVLSPTEEANMITMQGINNPTQ